MTVLERNIFDNPSRCLICVKSYIRRYNLSRYYRKRHLDLFTQPFSCPLCHITVCGIAEWTSHVRETHGEQHALTLDSWRMEEEPDIQPLVCPFPCHNLLKDASHLIDHIDRYHLGRRACFVVPYDHMHNWLRYARTTTTWQFAQSLVQCQGCGWIGTSNRGLTRHRGVCSKEPSPCLETSLKRERQETEGDEAEQTARKRVRGTAVGRYCSSRFAVQ